MGVGRRVRSLDGGGNSAARLLLAVRYKRNRLSLLLHRQNDDQRGPCVELPLGFHRAAF